jgi:ABC-type glycerol-3-phosphate transport system substrate-binding protein
VGLLYYRADRVRAPRSWQDVFRQSKAGAPGAPLGLRLQDETYEGLTVVLLELAYSAGARPIVTNGGKTADIDQPAIRTALKFMRDAIRERVIPRTRPTDAGTLDLYERGRSRFLRAWPYVAARLQADANKGKTPQTRRARRTTADNTKIVSLPPWRPGGKSFGVLGGHDLVIPRTAHNPSGALRLIDYLTSDTQVRIDEQGGQYPVLKAVANDLDPTNRALMSAIKHTDVKMRPAIPQYADVSRIIAKGVEAALNRPADDTFASDKLQQIQRDAQSVLNRGPT